LGCSRNLARVEFEDAVAMLALPPHSPGLMGGAVRLIERIGGEGPGQGDLFYRARGEAGEEVAADEARRVLGTMPDGSFTPRAHGPDLIHQLDGVPVVIEVKTVSHLGTFQQHLGSTGAGRQMSDSWLAAHGVDPTHCIAIGIEVTVGEQGVETTILARQDPGAKFWTPITRVADLVMPSRSEGTD
jgi:hypothetical protein